MVQARHPNRLPDDQIMALVPAQYREGAKIIYSIKADSYRIYRVIGYEYKSDVQRTYVKRLTLGYIKQGKWIKSESFAYQEEIDELKTKLAAEGKKKNVASHPLVRLLADDAGVSNTVDVINESVTRYGSMTSFFQNRVTAFSRTE